MITVIDTPDFDLVSPFVVVFRLGYKFQPGDVACCYVRAQGVTGPPGWTAAQTNPLGALFWKVLTGPETGPRFQAVLPIDLKRCGGTIFRGLEPTSPITADWAVPVVEQ